MKKSTIFAVSLLIIFAISMSVLLVGCNNSDKLVGSWKKEGADHSTLSFAKANNNIILTKYESFATSDFEVKYNKNTKEYEVINTSWNMKALSIKIIDDNTIEVKEQINHNQSYKYIRVS